MTNEVRMDVQEAALEYLTVGGVRLAYRRRKGTRKDVPGVLFLSGFKSDMEGSKATALDGWAEARGLDYVRFDYFAHGKSEGDWEEGSIGRWKLDVLAVLDRLTEGPQWLVGSSMGGWLALLAALARPEKVAGLVLLAPAPDFTEDLMFAAFDDRQRADYERDGRVELPDCYGGDGYVVTRWLIEEARDHLLLRGAIGVGCPVHILQGMQDEDVPWERAVRLVQAFSGDKASLVLVKDGDHRLSREEDLEMLCCLLDYHLLLGHLR